MRGYLQRMAAAAVNPERRVHPLVESAFAARREDAGEWGGEVVSERTVSGGPVFRGPAVSDRRPASVSETGQVGDARRSSDVPPTRDGEAATNGAPGFEALLPESRRNEAARDGAPGEGTVVGEPAAGDRGSAVVSDSEVGMPALPRRASDVPPTRDASTPPAVTNGAPRFEALVRETSAAVERRVARRDEPAVGDRRPAIGEAARAVNVRSAQEGAAGRTKATHPIAMGLRKDGPPGIPRGGAGDEIQIHIGRIEVTAMPPAAPRPVAAPVRKTQTLDEYLRRGNGRAG